MTTDCLLLLTALLLLLLLLLTRVVVAAAVVDVDVVAGVCGVCGYHADGMKPGMASITGVLQQY